MRNPRRFAGDFFDSCLIVSDWVKLFCNRDVVCFVWFRCFSSLTGDFAGKFERGDGKFMFCCSLGRKGLPLNTKTLFFYACLKRLASIEAAIVIWLYT